MAEDREKWREWKENELFISDALAEIQAEAWRRGLANARRKIDDARARGEIEAFLQLLEQKGVDPDSAEGRKIFLRWMDNKLTWNRRMYRAAFDFEGDQ